MREPGQTFAPADIAWVDFETHSGVDIDAGTYRYMQHGTALAFACAVGDGDPYVVTRPRGRFFNWDDVSRETRDHHARVMDGKAIWAAWNASFDREVWNQLTDFPPLDPHHIIDVMAQATAAGLPGTLEGAARFAHVPIPKRPTGKELIKLFCLPTSTATPESHPDEWAEFTRYAADDISAMRGVFRCTLQLTIEEWQEYWASERVNLNGIAYDRTLAERADAMAKADKQISAGALSQLTGGVIDGVGQVKGMIKWLQGALGPADQEFLTRQEEQRDDVTGEVTKKARYSLDRPRIRLLTAMLDTKPSLTDSEERARRLLDIRQFGGSVTPAKFSRMLSSEVDGLLLGQFVFNGAAQTGRFSSRGIQLHNLMRDALPYEADAIDALVGGIEPDQFAKFGDDTVICRKLSMLIRPTLVPEDPDNAFVWGDWSQIEARILPWLAGSEARLDIFREVDRDPSLPDLYTRSSASMSGLPIEKIDKPLRQRGKVAELACGFGGGRNALQNMAANYNMFLDNGQAAEIVREWREANPWAVDYWAKLWEAFLRAYEAPGHLAEVGAVGYIFLKDYLGGTMLCRLPSGRFLTYRRVKWERIDEVDDNDVIVDSRWELTFARAFGRIKLWPGFLCENIVQASAADVLRGTLVRVIASPSMPMVRAHTHDELLLEQHVDRCDDTAERLTAEMERGFDWSVGLPLKAEPTIAYCYTKCEEAQGL